MADAGPSTREVLQISEFRNHRVYLQDTRIGPPMDGDWTPGIRRLDPQNTRIGPPMYGARSPRDKDIGPGILDVDQGLHGTRDFVGFKTSRDLGLRGIQDFARSRTSWDSRLRGTRDFVGSRTMQTTGTLHAFDQDLVLWCSLREHKLSDKIKTWTPLGIRLVVSVKHCVLFLWVLIGARTLPSELYRAK